MRLMYLFVILFALSNYAFSADDVCTESKNSIPLTPSTPTDSFETVSGNDNVLIDKRYNLMWMRCAVGESVDPVSKSCVGTADSGHWKDALTLAGTVNEGAGTYGFTDWRMPNIKELMSIVEHQCAYPAINGDLFRGESGYTVWSNTPASDVAYPNTDVWVVDFWTGRANQSSADTTNIYVRMVREYTP